MSAIEQVAKRLGNTRTVCRKCYVHPVILDSYMDGQLIDQLTHKAEKELKQIGRLPPQEAAVVGVLQQHLKQQAKRKV